MTCELCGKADGEHIMPAPPGEKNTVRACGNCVRGIEAVTGQKYLGSIYFLQAETGGPVKIGWTIHDPKRRLSAFQIGSPQLLTIRGVLPGTSEDEKELHRRFAEDRVRGEWFSSHVGEECLGIKFATA